MVIRKRKQIRLRKYNYSNAGWYFVTICTQNRECLFGNIVNNKIIINDIGNIIEKIWKKIPKRFNLVELDTFQIMPNHLHGIIVIVGAGFMSALNNINISCGHDKRATTRVAPTIGDIIGAFKSITTHT